MFIFQDVVWGQSLHFELDKKTSRYLNVAVLATSSAASENIAIQKMKKANIDTEMIGYVRYFYPFHY